MIKYSPNGQDTYSEYFSGARELVYCRPDTYMTSGVQYNSISYDGFSPGIGLALNPYSNRGECFQPSYARVCIARDNLSNFGNVKFQYLRSTSPSVNPVDGDQLNATSPWVRMYIKGDTSVFGDGIQLQKAYNMRFAKYDNEIFLIPGGNSAVHKAMVHDTIAGCSGYGATFTGGIFVDPDHQSNTSDVSMSSSFALDNVNGEYLNWDDRAVISHTQNYLFAYSFQMSIDIRGYRNFDTGSFARIMLPGLGYSYSANPTFNLSSLRNLVPSSSYDGMIGDGNFDLYHVTKTSSDPENSGTDYTRIWIRGRYSSTATVSLPAGCPHGKLRFVTPVPVIRFLGFPSYAFKNDKTVEFRINYATNTEICHYQS